MHPTRTAVALLVLLAACGGGGGDSAPPTGDLAITVSGLPSGPAAIVVTGPGGYNHAVTASTTLTALPTGTYTVTSSSVVGATATYSPTPPSASVAVTTSGASTAVTYALSSGSIALTVTGLAGGVNADVSITGPGVSQTLTASSTLYNLAAGTYTLTANIVAVGTTTFGGTPPTQQVVVSPSLTPVPASLAYSAMTGQLTVNVGGLPGGVNASVLVTGPFAYSHAITASGATVLSPLPLGTYTVTSSNVVNGPATYFPLTATQSSFLNSGALTGSNTVTYALPNLSIDGMYITQSAQSYVGGVPLIASRDGYLRVFVKSDHDNTFTPQVRVRWYSSGTLVETDMIAAPAASVPLAINEGLLSSSWNLPVPKALIQSGLSVLVDVDPTNAITEGNEGDNSFPASGTALDLDVRNATPAHVTLVPVHTPDGFVGNVTPANQDTYMAFTQKIHPIPSYVATTHAVYNASTGPLRSNDSNGAWNSILVELDALRTANGVPESEHYYGVVDPTYSSGIAGLGYIGYPVAMGWDRGSNDQILAHEIGHNWNLLHAPCGNPSGVDDSYPYAGATLGMYGFNVAAVNLIAPTGTYDVMSYCRPQWISDYNYTIVMNYRVSFPDIVSAASRMTEPVLMVWGHMRGGQMVLEPAFEFMGHAALPEGRGAYTLEALDANGGTLYASAFEGHEVADEPGGGRGFVFAIPVSRFDVSQLAELRIAGRGGEARRKGGAVAAAMRAGRRPGGMPTAKWLGAGRASVTWDGASYPMAMIRDARTHQVIAFARGGAAVLAAPGAELEITLSDGVRSAKEIVIAQ